MKKSLNEMMENTEESQRLLLKMKTDYEMIDKFSTPNQDQIK